MNEKEETKVSVAVTPEDLRDLILHMEHLEEKVQTLTRRLAAVEGRASRFTDFFRYMLLLYDRVNARLHLLDGLTGKEEVEEILKSKTDRKPRAKEGLRSSRKALAKGDETDEEPQARAGSRVAA
jgi:hypothetical protein